MKFLGGATLIAAILLGGQTQTASAIYKDDVGVLDFSVATAGHGTVGWTSFYDNDKDTNDDNDNDNDSDNDDTTMVLTSDVPTRSSPSTSCYVASRSMGDGSLAWRRNVCSVADEAKQSHSVAASGTSFYTVDNMGIARAWNTLDGGLLWDARVSVGSGGGTGGSAPPKVFAVNGYAAVAAGNELVFLDAETGARVDSVVGAAASGAKGGLHVEWLSALSTPSSASTSTSTSTMHLAFAKVDSATGIIASGSDFYAGRYEIGGDFKPGAGVLKAKEILADSVISYKSDKNGVLFGAVTASGSVAHTLNGSVPAKSCDDSWGAVVGIRATADPSVVLLSGVSENGDAGDATMEAFRTTGTDWEKISAGVVAYAPALGAVLTTPTGRAAEVRGLDGSEVLDTIGDTFGADGDSVAIVSVLEKQDAATILIGTERGSTKVITLAKNGGNKVSLTVNWSAEEGLANLSSAIILDASHSGSDDLVEEKNEVAYRLSMAGRLKAQWQEIGSVVSTANGLIGGGDEKFSYRDHLFGFLKVSALLSSKNHRVWGMISGGADRGSIRWSLDLPKSALWHSMVHGTTNAAKAAHGIHGDTHSREILVLSASPNRVDWMCIDGTSGAINAQDSIAIASPIQQVVPVYGGSSGGCRQASLLLGEDLSLTAVPADAQTDTLIKQQLSKTPNGFYTHKVDTLANKVQSYRVSRNPESQGFVASPVGLTSFAGEQIVKVAYPLRHEDMQSMSTVLGDNSLLLKYVNPHMAVVVTMLTNQDDQKVTDVATAIEMDGDGSGGKKKRKPLGVGAPGSSTSTAQQQPFGTAELPNMFVNLVDTVSGRVLYRHSHASVDADKTVSVAISENWVIYSYVNAKTRRTELGVLTLHEGMIEPKGLTYFSRPEQSSTFSSFDARESKPVVLSKVYNYPKTVTAMGVTSTRQGISRQNVLVASADGSLTSINKMILETRRPVGEVKPDEKKEGLMPYHELIPDSPLFSLNYNQTHESFSSIVSSTTALESQSLVFAFGGPDLFFTRTSPTKGFDLLPDTFNKALVGCTTVAIVVGLLVVQRMGKAKQLKHGWS